MGIDDDASAGVVGLVGTVARIHVYVACATRLVADHRIAGVFEGAHGVTGEPELPGRADGCTLGFGGVVPHLTPHGVRHEDDLGALQGEDAADLGKPVVVADGDSDAAGSNVEDGDLGAAFVMEHFIAGEVDFSLRADVAVRPGQDLGIVDEIALLLAEAHGEKHAQLGGQPADALSRGAFGNGLRVVPGARIAVAVDDQFGKKREAGACFPRAAGPSLDASKVLLRLAQQAIHADGRYFDVLHTAIQYLDEETCMPVYPGSEEEQRISAEELRAIVAGLFVRCGMSDGDAGHLAESLVRADLRGVHSHGVMRVPEYVKKLCGGGVNPTGRPRVVRDSGGALVIDGDNAMGQIAAEFAMRQAIERARTVNVAVAVVRGSNHCGAMFQYAEQALAEDMIGMATTNALPTMAPWGGVDKIVGINPLAVAIPAGEEAPIVLDAAFSFSSHGKIRIFQQKGVPIPANWAFDSEGKPTTDTAAAIHGLLQPIGEYKGVGLAVVMGILSSLLSGAAYGTELGNMVEGARAGQDGHFFLALRIGAFEETARFKQRVDGVIRQIRGGRRAEGVERIYAPGGLEADTEARYRREGIPLNAVTLAGLRTD